MESRKPLWKPLRDLLEHRPRQPEAFITEGYREAQVALRERFPSLPHQGLLAAVRSEMPDLLWSDLKRLQTLRNQVVHEAYVPDGNDSIATAMTLERLIRFLGGDLTHPKSDSSHVDQASSSRIHWKEFQNLANEFFTNHFESKLLAEVELTLENGSRHRFDLASTENEILIECKSYTWTKAGNEPAAKLNNAKTDAQSLKLAQAKRRVLVFDDDLHPLSRKSLADLFVRRNMNWLGDIEVWRRLDGVFEQIWPR